MFSFSRSLLAVRNPLSWAADNGHQSVAELPLEKGVDATSKDECGQTPLLLAAANAHSALVRLFLNQRSLDLESKDKDSSVMWS
jgi:ankyrin repeat protein